MDFYFHTIVNLPKDFHVTLVYIDPLHVDEVTKSLFERADNVVLPSSSHDELVPLLYKSQYDMILYPEIGMSNAIYYLSMLKLAPIQIAIIGHPETSGSKAIDYYISWKNFHNINPKDQFSETVIQLENLPICYDYPKMLDKANKSLKELGLFRKNMVLFSIPMTLFKIQPEFDEVIKRIIMANKNHMVLMVCCNNIEKLIAKRLKSFLSSQQMDQLIFSEQFSHSDYFSLLKNSDVVLETFPFGGGNTVLHSMAAGTPVISMRGNQLKGAFGTGFYDWIGEHRFSVNTVDEYIDLAIKVANDKEIKTSFKAMVEKNKTKLFGNMAGPNEFYDWLKGIFKTHLG